MDEAKDKARFAEEQHKARGASDPSPKLSRCVVGLAAVRVGPAQPTDEPVEGANLFGNPSIATL